MKIQTFFSAGILIIGAVAAVAGGTTVLEQWRALQTANYSAELTRTYGHSARFMEQIYIERGLLSQFIVGAAPPSVEAVSKLKRQQSQTDEILSSIINSAKTLDAQLNNAATEQSAKAISAIKSARARSEKEWQKERSASNPQERAAISREVVAEMIIGIDTVRNLGAELERELIRLEPHIAEIAGIARLANELRDAVGRRSTYISQYMGSGKGFNAETHKSVQQLTGRIDTIFENLERAIARVGMVSSLKEAVERTRREYRHKGEPRYNEFITLAVNQAPPPMAVPEWWDWTQSTLSATLAARDPAIDAAIKLANEMANAYSAKLGFMILISLVIVTLIAIFAITFSRQIVRPLTELTQNIETISSDNLENPVPWQKRSDEVGLIARALEVLRISAKKARHFAEAAQEERKLLEQNVRNELASGFDHSATQSFNLAATVCNSTKSAVTDAANLAENVADEVKIAIAEVKQLSDSVGYMASASEHLAFSITEINHQANASLSSVSAARQDAGEAADNVMRLTQLSANIGDIVGLIGNIASQTNLLALNATIEAARAGSAGRGFAIVAQEVKDLAQQTADATGQISARINDMQAAIGSSTSLIAKIANSAPEIEKSVQAIVQAVSEQDAATAEIAHNISQAAARAAALGGITKGLTETVAKGSDAAKTATVNMAELEKHLDGLSDATSTFVDNMRAA